MVAQRVLLVGGGLTAAAVACRLASLPLQVTVWDKAHRLGGRMATHWWGKNQVDLGPQYITRQMEGRDQLIGELLKCELIRPVTSHPEDLTNVNEDVQVSSSEGVKQESKAVDDLIWTEGDGSVVLCKPDNYQTTSGTQAIVEYLWNRSGVKPELDHFLYQLDATGPHWTAINKSRTKEECFDAVVLTIPVPQFIENWSPEGKPHGNYLQKIEENTEVLEKLKMIKYCTTFSVGVMYNTAVDLSLNWHNKYFPENEIIRYVSVDSVRRGQTGPTSLSVQTQRQWSLNNIDLHKDEAKFIILEELEKIIPSLPPPDHLIGHKWRYSQTEEPYPSSPGAVKLVNKPLLIGAGDSFSLSNVTGCLHSAEVAVSILKSCYGLS